jgi:hypothetical protein
MSDSDEMSRVVERQGDRIISAVTAGPHDKIVDPVGAHSALIVLVGLILIISAPRMFTPYGKKW